MRNPYEALGLSRGATPDEIKAAFRKLAALHHPDRNPGDDGAQQRFKDLNAAYQLLSDPQKKAMFDRFGTATEGVSPFAQGMPFDFADFAANLPMDGLLGDLLQRFGFKSGDRGDLRKELFVTLEEAAFGAEKEIAYERVQGCKTCGGGGSRPGATARLCDGCGGKGRVRLQQGIFPIAVERECPRCQGRGRVVTDPCVTCRGAGLISQSRRLVVTIPPGVEDSATRLVEGAGNMPRADRPAGDLELLIRIQPHPFFQRVGDDVRGVVPISFAQACLGGEVQVPTLEGKGKLRIPPATQTGTVLRIKNKGITKRAAGGRGDQLVEVKVEVPLSLSARAKELVEALASELGEAVQPQQKTFVEKLKELFG